MKKINLLDKNTIDKIAAGEVIDRPSSIVKELLENAIDAKATAVTVEIKDGGISFIRITDNGIGIEKDDIKIAFLRHATSKIRKVEDLLSATSLGFRGEALSSIAAVTQLECISKTPSDLTGVRYVIEGGVEKSFEEIGAPAGTTFIVRNLFFNTPARKKFLKTAQTEGAYISAIVEKIALSHPEVSIRFINNNQNKLHTSGNKKVKDIIYSVFGRDITSNILEVDDVYNSMKLTGYIGKPVISRGNRNQMIYFINGRFIKSKIISSAIEDAYKPFIMQHNYPFCVLYFDIASDLIDVNVHPSKMEIRFENQSDVYQLFYNAVTAALTRRELINEVTIENDKAENDKAENNKAENNKVESNEVENHIVKNNICQKISFPEPFEVNRISELRNSVEINQQPDLVKEDEGNQLELFDDRFLSKKEKVKHKMIGQLFDTYWLIEYGDQLYIVDQHAAHEKVLFEKFMKSFREKEINSQMINPPIILNLSMEEQNMIKKFEKNFRDLGFEIEEFGGNDYAVRAVPANLYSIGEKELLINLIDTLTEDATELQSELIYEKIASMSCKAAVKGNNRLSVSEADALIEQLLYLDNPYNCPHGRPTIISMSKYEIEKKFKRII